MDRARAAFALALAMALGAAACGKQIGDGCQTATDCSPNGGRICDLAQPGGYCTILGCDETTCPSEATCIRFFPSQFLTRPCNPYCEDRPPGVSTGDAGAVLDAGVTTPPLCPGLSPGRQRHLSHLPQRAHQRLQLRRDLPGQRPVRAPIERDALLHEGLLQQRRLPQRLRVPAHGDGRWLRAVGDTLRADRLLLAPVIGATPAAPAPKTGRARGPVADLSLRRLAGGPVRAR